MVLGLVIHAAPSGWSQVTLMVMGWDQYTFISCKYLIPEVDGLCCIWCGS